MLLDRECFKAVVDTNLMKLLSVWIEKVQKKQDESGIEEHLQWMKQYMNMQFRRNKAK